MNKFERIIDALGNYYDAGAIFFRKGHNWEALYHQLEYLGKTSKDDYADASALAVKFLEKPGTLIEDIDQIPSTSTHKTIVQKMGGLFKNQKHSDVWRF